MLRKAGFLLALGLATLAADLRPAAAAGLSPNNPYRSFNITGYNYGSMQWERSHRGSYGGRRAYHGGWFFRRR
jgi:hypothetical protein